MRFLILAAFLFALAGPLAAQTDLYSFPDIDELKAKKVKKKPVDPFVRALSKKMEVEQKILTKASEKGLGRSEMIRLILMSKESGKPIGELIKERQKGTRMAKIASSVELNNRKIRKEAFSILKELEKEIQNIRSDPNHSTTTIAGVDSLTKSTTDQHGPDQRKSETDTQ